MWRGGQRLYVHVGTDVGVHMTARLGWGEVGGGGGVCGCVGWGWVGVGGGI